MMSLELVELLKEVRATRSTLEHRDQRADQLEQSINDIYRPIGRPGIDCDDRQGDDERKSASAYLAERHVHRIGGPEVPDFAPGVVDQAIVARKAFASYCRAADFAHLPDD